MMHINLFDINPSFSFELILEIDVVLEVCFERLTSYYKINYYNSGMTSRSLDCNQNA